MTPAIWASEEDIKVKIQAYNALQTSKHWSSDGVSVFIDKKPSVDTDMRELPEIAKTDAVRQLVGDLPYAFNDGKPNGPEWKPKWAKK